MTCTMRLELYFAGGGYIEKDILYIGETAEEIAENIMRDENELLHYMQTNDDKGVKAFCFGGFNFVKHGLIAARMVEPDF